MPHQRCFADYESFLNNSRSTNSLGLISSQPSPSPSGIDLEIATPINGTSRAGIIARRQANTILSFAIVSGQRTAAGSSATVISQLAQIYRNLKPYAGLQLYILYILDYISLRRLVVWVEINPCPAESTTSIACCELKYSRITSTYDRTF